jgi:hypothetical protein
LVFLGLFESGGFLVGVHFSGWILNGHHLALQRAPIVDPLAHMLQPARDEGVDVVRLKAHVPKRC